MKEQLKIQSLARTAIAAFFVVSCQILQADPIHGTISFSGDVTPYASLDGTGSPVAAYNLAQSLVLSGTTVSSATGSFQGVADGTAVSMLSPLRVNPTVPPSPANTPLWSVGGFTFTLTSLTEPVDTPTLLVVEAQGVISDGNPADSNAGNWLVDFTSSGMSLSWNATSDPPLETPDSGTTLLLLGFGLISLGIFARFSKRNAAI